MTLLSNALFTGSSYLKGMLDLDGIDTAKYRNDNCELRVWTYDT